MCVGKREIKALKVKCDNSERNCQWEGTVGTLEAHVATCEYTPLPCQNECIDMYDNKIAHFMRKDLDEHLEYDCPNRDHECEYCGEEGTYSHITQVHDEICEQRILPCPNNCSETMPRCEIEEHVKFECEFTVVTCKFEKIGCKVEMKRGDIEEHEEDANLHLSLALDTVVELQELRGKVSKLESATEELDKTLNDGQSITFNVTGFQGKYDSGKDFLSLPFYTSPGGYHMAIRVYAKGDESSEGTHVSVFAPILEGKYDTELRWPFVGKVTITLLNQLEDNNHKTKKLTLDAENCAMVNGPTGSAWGFSKFIHHSELAHNRAKNTQYLKDDTLYFRVSVKVSDHKPWLECTTK